MFENRVLREIFEPKRDEVTSDWRRLHNGELRDLYCSPKITRVIKQRRMRWAGNVARMGDRRGAYRVSVWRLDGKRPFGRYKIRWGDNIKMDLQEVEWGCVWLGIGTGGERL